MIPRGLDSCTKCGRQIPPDEVAHVSYSKGEESIGIRVICALHTDHDTAGTWHED